MNFLYIIIIIVTINEFYINGFKQHQHTQFSVYYLINHKTISQNYSAKCKLTTTQRHNIKRWTGFRQRERERERNISSHHYINCSNSIASGRQRQQIKYEIRSLYRTNRRIDE